ncbi:MAG: hypothetical protein L0H26_12160 [Microlunatus sp.]|nr:hypothetical protein [Microlunatus sp.]
MNPKPLTWVLGALALSLTVALVVVLLQRPTLSTETVTAPPPASPAPATETTTTTTGPSPSAQETDPAAEGGPSPLPSSEVEAHDASPGTTPYSQTGEARRDWQPVVTGFGRAFTATKGKNAAQWRASLAPYVTAKVRDQLATVALRKVPTDAFDSIEPAEFGDDKVAVFVHYDTGLTLVTYLIIDGSRWRVYAYDRWED